MYIKIMLQIILFTCKYFKSMLPQQHINLEF